MSKRLLFTLISLPGAGVFGEMFVGAGKWARWVEAGGILAAECPVRLAPPAALGSQD